jgi:scyllo-inositol 2-dehydrogenase (NADP+)
MTIRVGLLGYGLAGRYFHAPLLRTAGFDIAAVASSRANEIRETLPDAAIVASADELIQRDDIDLVVVATPTQAHEQQVRAALEAGKHVVVDKPFTVTAQQGRELAAFAASQGRMLSVFHNRRWDNDFLTLQQLLRDGVLGEIHGYHARWDRFRPEPSASWRNLPEPASGMLYDLGSHMLDQVLVLFGRPDWIQGDVFTQRPGALADDGFELLLGKGRLRITLGVSYLASEGGWRYRVHGTQASYLKRELDPQEDQSRAGIAPDDPRFGVEAAELAGTLVHGATGRSETIPSYAGSWVTYYRSVYDCIANGAPNPVPAEQAAEVIELIEAAYRSAREGRRVALS